MAAGHDVPMGRLRAESQSAHRLAAERHWARAPHSVLAWSSEPVRYGLTGALLPPVEARLAQAAFLRGAPFQPRAPMLEVKPAARPGAERPLRVATALHLREVWKEAPKKAEPKKAEPKKAEPKKAELQ